MDWNRIEGNWKQFKGKAKEKWGRLTDDDLDVINGQQDQLEGKLQERYGLAKDQAKKDVDTWFRSLQTLSEFENAKDFRAPVGALFFLNTVPHRAANSEPSDDAPTLITDARLG